MSETLNSLADRVEQGTGPDRELDRLIAFKTHFRPAEPMMRESFDLHEKRHDYATAWIAHATWHNLFNIPAYTSSIDAVEALRRDRCPSSHIECWVFCDFTSCALLIDGQETAAGKAPTEPRARLAAVLRAIGGQDV